MKPEQKITRPKLADDDGYRVAAEALSIVIDHAVKNDALHNAMFQLVQREAKRVEGRR